MDVNARFDAIVASADMRPVVVIPPGEVNLRLAQAARNAQLRANALQAENLELRNRLARMGQPA